jgi:hypothetical protein
MDTTITINEVWKLLASIFSGLILLVTFYKLVIKKTLSKFVDIQFKSRGTKTVEDLEIKMSEKLEKFDNSCLIHKGEIQKFHKEIFDSLKEINNRLDESERKRDIARKDTIEKNELIIEGLTASLKAHKDAGANGSVTPALKALEEYKTKKASEVG